MSVLRHGAVMVPSWPTGPTGRSPGPFTRAPTPTTSPTQRAITPMSVSQPPSFPPSSVLAWGTVARPLPPPTGPVHSAGAGSVGAGPFATYANLSVQVQATPAQPVPSQGPLKRLASGPFGSAVVQRQRGSGRIKPVFQAAKVQGQGQGPFSAASGTVSAGPGIGSGPFSAGAGIVARARQVPVGPFGFASGVQRSAAGSASAYPTVGVPGAFPGLGNPAKTTAAVALARLPQRQGHGLLGICEPQPKAHPLDDLADIEFVRFRFPPTVQNAVPAFYARLAVGSPRGVALLFHGKGVDIEEFITGTEPNLLAQDLIRAGYAVAGLNAVNVRDGWNASPLSIVPNADLVNALDFWKWVRDPANGVVDSPETPVVAWGGSNGGNFAALFALEVITQTQIQHGSPPYWPHLFPEMAGVSVHISAGHSFRLEFNNQGPGRLPPLYYVLGVADTIVDEHLDATNAFLGELALDQDYIGPVVSVTNHKSIVTPGRFTRIQGVTCDQSVRIGQALKRSGWIDEFDIVVRNPRVDENANEAPVTIAEKVAALGGALAAELGQETVRQVFLLLSENYSEHAVTAEFDQGLIRFFDQRIS